MIIGDVRIEVKIKIPTYKRLYKQLKKYRKKYRKKCIILYIYTDAELDANKKKDLRKLMEKGVVDKILFRCVDLKRLYKVEYKKDRYVIIPV